MLLCLVPKFLRLSILTIIIHRWILPILLLQSINHPLVALILHALLVESIKMVPYELVLLMLQLVIDDIFGAAWYLLATGLLWRDYNSCLLRLGNGLRWSNSEVVVELSIDLISWDNNLTSGDLLRHNLLLLVQIY